MNTDKIKGDTLDLEPVQVRNYFTICILIPLLCKLLVLSVFIRVHPWFQ